MFFSLHLCSDLSIQKENIKIISQIAKQINDLKKSEENKVYGYKMYIIYRFCISCKSGRI